ncbi:MAG: TnpV protein [Clostridia bacterium]
MKEITYHKEGDYLIPDLALKNQENVVLGKYGRARLKYIKENKRGLYTELMMNGSLSSYLRGIDKRCNHIVNITVREMAKENNVNEELKRTDQLKWVGLMNNFKNVAEEIVFNEIIYV